MQPLGGKTSVAPLRTPLVVGFTNLGFRLLKTLKPQNPNFSFLKVFFHLLCNKFNKNDIQI